MIEVPINGVHKNCLAAFLGFEYQLVIDFLRSLGLLKQGHSQLPSAITVVKAEWDKFIEEEELGDIMETITKNFRFPRFYQMGRSACQPTIQLISLLVWWLCQE